MFAMKKKECVVYIIVFILVNLFVNNIQGQKVRDSYDKRFKEYYNVLPSDSTIFDGEYKLFYKSTLIEKGAYKNGKRSGIWFFYNLGGSFEFEYDFDNDSLLNIAGLEFYKRRNQLPSLYLGSPLVPYVFISSKVGYPKEAYDKGIVGKVVLTLKISEEGEIVDRYISESLNEIMDSAVLKAAWNFPESWEWIPAKYDGVKVKSLYNITVFFD